MDASIRTAASQLLSAYTALPSSRDRLLVGIVGAPGSGKSELALALAEELRKLKRGVEGSEQENGAEGKEDEEGVIVVGMDGWHYTRAELDNFADPADAHARRGAHDTFDAHKFVSFVRALRSTNESAKEDIAVPTSLPNDSQPRASPPDSDQDMPSRVPTPLLRAPSFSHALKDPLPDTIHIHPTHRIVLIEGLYVALDLPPWNVAGKLLDQILLIEVDEDVARGRIVKRHIKAGLANTEEEAGNRADLNDIPNGRFLLSKLLPPTIRIRSVDDPKLSTQ